MIEDGPQGLNGSRWNRPGEGDVLEDGDISLYGINWEDMEDKVLMVHHHHYHSVPLDNPFVTGPPSLSEVECTSPNSPLSAEGICQLDHYLSQMVDVNSRSMLVRRIIWAQALRICGQIL